MSWSIANNWNDNDEDMKEDLDDYEMFEVKKESSDEVSDSKINSLIGTVDVKTGSKVVRKKTNVKVKSESDELPDSCDSVIEKIKTEEREEDNYEGEGLQLKNEEVDIKPEDEDG